jgi:lysocardiolipin and lysophospholipid acyltransferase
MRTTMADEGLALRYPAASASASIQPVSTEQRKQEQNRKKKMVERQHPGGAIKHGTWAQALRMFLFFLYFIGGCIAWVYSLLTERPAR